MSEEPKRYHPEPIGKWNAVLSQSPEGNYVRYDDYARERQSAEIADRVLRETQSDLAAARAQVEALTKALKDRTIASVDFHESWVDAAEDCKRLEAANAKLVGALGLLLQEVDATCGTIPSFRLSHAKSTARTALADAGKGAAP